jgi:1,4-dihydroxy-2-naphthoate octaprenyltransferase
MTYSISPLAVAASIPVGCLVAAILVVNNLRDIDTDRAAGKRTLAVRMGPEATRREYAALLALAYACPVVVWGLGLASLGALLTWVTAPVAAMLMRQVMLATGRALNPVLAGTARLCLWFALAFAAGIVV